MDYQNIKEAEFQQREERSNVFPVHHPTPKSRSSAEAQHTPQKPPAKPRRSVKCRPAAQQETEQLTTQSQQKHKEVTVKRIAPALVLGPVGPLEALTPSLRAHTLLWFERTQLPRLRTPGQPLPCWLHGFATRREAEDLLQDKPRGCFLLRLSESKIGFVLSYRGEDRCRHFIIEEEDRGTFGAVYLIAGESSHHQSLQDLINYYTHNPVGPFNETLTVPCMQGSGETERLRLKNQEGEEKENINENKNLPIAAGPAALDPSPTNSSPSTREEPVQYAAVRKPLKKTYSLPECTCGPDTAPPSAQNGGCEFAEISSNLRVTEDQTHPVDAPYARVNKPPRAVSENNPNATAHSDLQGATAASTPPSDPTADQKYWTLEPMHTYEETVHTRTRDEEIDCYAVGWRRQLTGELVELSKNHLYSEVNIKGAQEGPSVSRCSPSVPQRPPPRSAHTPAFGLSSLVAQTQNSGFHHSEQTLEVSSSSMYEQIPVRPTSSRPSLPPPNPKR